MAKKVCNLTQNNRNPLDYLVSGAITSGVISGAFNYTKVKEESLGKKDAIANTLKVSSQAGIASASAIASVNYLENRNYLAATLSLAFGVGSVIALEKISSNFTPQLETEKKSKRTKNATTK